MLKIDGDLTRLQQAADYRLYFRRLRKQGLYFALFGLALAWLAFDARAHRWGLVSAAVAALWAFAHAALLASGWLTVRPYAYHWLLAAALLALAGVTLAELTFDPPAPGMLPRSLMAPTALAIFGGNALFAYHRRIGAAIKSAVRPEPALFKQLDAQVAAIKGGDPLRDDRLIEITVEAGPLLRAALRPEAVVLLAEEDHLMLYHPDQFNIIPDAPGEEVMAHMNLRSQRVAVRLAPGTLKRYLNAYDN